MGKTILVVDDDVGIAGLVSTMVELAGHTAIPAYGGMEALDKHESMDLDLILLDLAMPDMDGFAVLEEIRRREQDGKSTPVFLLTAHGRSYVSDSKQRQEVDGIISKPLTARKLMDVLAQFFAGQEAN